MHKPNGPNVISLKTRLMYVTTFSDIRVYCGVICKVHRMMDGENGVDDVLSLMNMLHSSGVLDDIIGACSK